MRWAQHVAVRRRCMQCPFHSFSKFCVDCGVCGDGILSPHDASIEFQRVSPCCVQPHSRAASRPVVSRSQALAKRTASRFAGLSMASNSTRLEYTEFVDLLRRLGWLRFKHVTSSLSDCYDRLVAVVGSSPGGRQGGPLLNTTTRTNTHSGVFARLTDKSGFTGTHQSRQARLRREAERISAHAAAAVAATTMMDEQDIQAVIGGTPRAGAGRRARTVSDASEGGARQPISRHRRVSLSVAERAQERKAILTELLLADFGDTGDGDEDDTPFLGARQYAAAAGVGGGAVQAVPAHSPIATGGDGGQGATSSFLPGTPSTAGAQHQAKRVAEGDHRAGSQSGRVRGPGRLRLAGAGASTLSPTAAHPRSPRTVVRSRVETGRRVGPRTVRPAQYSRTAAARRRADMEAGEREGGNSSLFRQALAGR